MSIIQWLPILGIKEIKEVIINSLSYLQNNKGLVIYAYIIMENHLHLIVQANGLQDIIAKFKSFTARQIIDFLDETRHKEILKLLSFFKLLHKKDREYQLWQEGIHPVQIDNEKIMKQKVEYIHDNPVKKGYVDDPVNWVYSSARNYCGLESVIEVKTDW